MFGFTYNGVHSSQFGLYYTQTPDEKWFNDPEYDVYDTNVDWRHGGYYFDSKAKKRTFTIKCYFEEIDIATRQQIKQWLKRGSIGKLIFDDMPFVYWNVRPGKIPVGNWYLDNGETHSGTVTIVFNAYEPFGYLIRKSNSPSSPDDGATDYCNIINSDDMPELPTTSSISFDIYNPGTESCGLSIEISGVTNNPIRFFNESNQTMCEFGSLPPDEAYLSIDGETGYVTTYIDAAYPENGYSYHDKGVVRIDPNRGYSEIPFVYRGMSGTTYVFELDGVYLNKDFVNSTMTIEGVANTTFTIISVSATLNRIYCTKEGDGVPGDTGYCSFKTVNHIAIQEYINDQWTEPTTLSLSYINVDYDPRVL